MKKLLILQIPEYQNILNDNEYEYLINHYHKISNFHINPKLHKSKELNEIIKNQNFEHLNINKNLRKPTNCCWTSLLH